MSNQNQYSPKIDVSLIPANRQLLLDAGFSKDEANLFAARNYAALPAWVRTRLKAIAHPDTRQEARKLKPAAGELAFYLNPQKFPSMPHAPKQQKTFVARQAAKPLPVQKAVAVSAEPTVRDLLVKAGLSPNQVEKFAAFQRRQMPFWLQRKIKKLTAPSAAVPVAA